MVFVAVCGLLTTTTNVYCVDQLTSTPEQRRKRKWPGWPSWRQPDTNLESGYSICENSPNPTISLGARGNFEMINVSPRAPLASTASSVERVGASQESIPEEPLSPADGFSPNAQPGLQDQPPTYEQATLMQLRSAQPTIVNVPGPAGNLGPAASPRPPIIRRQATNLIPTQRLLHKWGPPAWSSKGRVRNLLWKLCLSALFVSCIAPFIISCSVQFLVRDSVYVHACDGYEWEVILDTKDGLPKSPSSPLILPTAEFIDRTGAESPASSFTMEMSLDITPTKPKNPAKSKTTPTGGKSNPGKQPIKVQGTNKSSQVRAPRVKEKNYYDRFFHLKTSQKSLTHQLLSLVSYDTITHSYRGTFAAPNPSGGSLNMVGGYTPDERMKFPELGLRQVMHEQDDYFGFPRVVLERQNKGDWGEVMVTSRVKRQSCAELKVCVKGIKATVAAVAVGPLLLEAVEAAGKCKKGSR